jgi:hypothetical protein
MALAIIVDGSGHDENEDDDRDDDRDDGGRWKERYTVHVANRSITDAVILPVLIPMLIHSL